jgi:hypothetical protein
MMELVRSTSSDMLDCKNYCGRRVASGQTACLHWRAYLVSKIKLRKL